METPGNTNPAILNQMLDEASGTKLPEPTIADNGKVLGVADGAYALVSGGGGGGGAEPLIVNSTETGIDASFNEIKTALLAGRAVWLYSGDGDSNAMSYTPLVSLGTSVLGDYLCAFSDGTLSDNFSSEDSDTDMSSAGDGGGR